MKLLCVIGQLGNGGTEKQLYLFLRHLDRGEHSASVFVSGPSEGIWRDRIRELGVEIHSCVGSGMLSKVMDYRRVLSRERPDVVFSWSFFTNALVWASGSKRFVGSLRQEYAQSKIELSYLRRRLSLSPQSLVVNSSHSAEELIYAGISADRIHKIFNMFQRRACFAGSAGSIEARGEARSRYGIPDNALVLAGVGRDCPAKDFGFFVDTVEALGCELDDRRLLVLLLGSGGTAVKGMIAERGLGKYFILPGEVPEAAIDLAAADVFFLSSRQEGMPNVLFEAIDAGCAVLATDVGGVRDILATLPEELLKKTLLRERDAKLAAAMLSELLRDRKLRQDFSNCSRDILAKFAPEAIMPQYCRVLGGIKCMNSSPRE
ncbi:MAG: glycosyltransferase [Victivallales bacterium]|nr:glycosyltransferase [Victivallales bacterium]